MMTYNISENKKVVTNLTTGEVWACPDGDAARLVKELTEMERDWKKAINNIINEVTAPLMETLKRLKP